MTEQKFIKHLGKKIKVQGRKEETGTKKTGNQHFFLTFFVFYSEITFRSLFFALFSILIFLISLTDGGANTLETHFKDNT